VAHIVSGVRGGVTIGSPVTLVLENKDHVNWTAQMGASKEGFAPKPVTRLRPGHADLAGALKYGHTDIRNVLERSSARETATRVAAGGVARKLLSHFGVEILSFTQSIGTVDIGYEGVDSNTVTVEDIEASPVRCPDPEASKRMVADIDEVGDKGDTLGGTFRIIARGVPPGWGEPVFERLDADLASAMMGINAVKGVEIGAGFGAVEQRGSEHRDELTPQGFKSNHAGGVLGGISSGQDIVVSLALKPTSSITLPGATIDIHGNATEVVTTGRHDPCVGIRATPIAEAMLALVLMDHYLRFRAQCGDVVRITPVITAIKNE